MIPVDREVGSLMRRAQASKDAREAREGLLIILGLLFVIGLGIWLHVRDSDTPIEKPQPPAKVSEVRSYDA